MQRRVFSVALTPEERAKLLEMARQRGVSAGALIRERVLGVPALPAKRERKKASGE